MYKTELWHCKHCNKSQTFYPSSRRKMAIVAVLRPGFMGVKLLCGHWVDVRKDKVYG